MMMRSTEQCARPTLGAVEGMACPRCRGPLAAAGGEIACCLCNRAWPVVNGIPHFVSEFPYWGEIPIEPMQEINRKAANGNWKAALLDSDDPVVRRAAVMILNAERANWHFLAPAPRCSRVLDIGAGTGTNTHGLALHYREVVAVEPVLERVEFMRHRFAQEGLSNVKVIRSSVWTLPFERESFDLVAMNGVLEWVAEGGSEDPGAVQTRALTNVLELLRPGAFLYLGIENRLGIGSFLGYPDPHCGLPFVTAAPRRLAHWYARRKGQPCGYRNYLYSSRGYRQLLHRAGFRSADVYLALPSYNHPQFFVPLSNAVFSYYRKRWPASDPPSIRRRIETVLSRLGLLKEMEYSFAIIAQK